MAATSLRELVQGIRNDANSAFVRHTKSREDHLALAAELTARLEELTRLIGGCDKFLFPAQNGANIGTRSS